MIDSQAPLASWFLWITAVFFMVVYALPLLFVPIRWARFFRWRVEETSDLTLYFGRCLGGVATASVLLLMEAAPQVSSAAWALSLTFWCSVFMIFVHVKGLVTKSQPWTENLEIILYMGTAVASYMFRTSLAVR